MRRKIRTAAAGKLNLSLNITGRDGYHRLDSVFVSVSAYDYVTVAERLDDTVRIDFPGIAIDPYASTVAKAVNALRAQFGGFGAEIVVEKGIPVGSGIGGSSADAAAVIRALDYLFGFTARGLDRAAAALKTGSDAPFMIRGGMARVRGIGEKLDFFEGVVPYTLVLAYPSEGVNTAACYAAFDRMYPSFRYCPSDNDVLVAALAAGDPSMISQFKNALTQPAVSLNPQVGEVLNALSANGADAAFMTGSGCGCVGVFRGAPDLTPLQKYGARIVEPVAEGVRFL